MLTAWEFGKAPEAVVEIVSNTEGGETTGKIALQERTRIAAPDRSDLFPATMPVSFRRPRKTEVGLADCSEQFPRNARAGVSSYEMMGAVAGEAVQEIAKKSVSAIPAECSGGLVSSYRVMTPGEVARLIDAHSAPLVLYARQWCDAPEDVVQEAFIKLVRQTRASEDAVAWLYRVVRNGALDDAKMARRRQRRESAAARRAPWFVEPEVDGLDAQTAVAALERLAPSSVRSSSPITGAV